MLLHGLGATGEVYAGGEALLPDARPGWLVLDLPGHERSGWKAAYTFTRQADAVRSMLPAARDLVIVGHSMGGAVALELATDPRVTRRRSSLWHRGSLLVPRHVCRWTPVTTLPTIAVQVSNLRR